jgi:hypothetical protein
VFGKRFTIVFGIHHFFKELCRNRSTEGRVTGTDGGLNVSGTTVFVKALSHGYFPAQRCKA